MLIKITWDNIGEIDILQSFVVNIALNFIEACNVDRHGRGPVQKLQQPVRPIEFTLCYFCIQLGEKNNSVFTCNSHLLVCRLRQLKCPPNRFCFPSLAPPAWWPLARFLRFQVSCQLVPTIALLINDFYSYLRVMKKNILLFFFQLKNWNSVFKPCQKRFIQQIMVSKIHLFMQTNLQAGLCKFFPPR